MKIAYSDVTMQSDRYYQQSGVRSAPSKANFKDEVFKTSSSSNTWSSNRSELTNMRDNLLQGLWSLLFGGNSTGGMQSLSRMSSFGGLSYFGSVSAMGSTMTQTMVNYSETEYTSFDAKGLAMTEDGRQIDFNINVSMSRSFMEFTQVQVPNPYALMDPLMINVGSDVANISDQKFRFDLDADGVEEEISMPGAGTGFLAYDANEDGIINDGTELFGALSGDGFGDLRQYDDDGNGWIDENDEIFSKLKVWYKNGDGEDELVDLLSADIGAIYLGSQDTDFSLYSENGTGDFMNAMIRATGFFLRESMGVGTVQHVDLAARILDDTSGTSTGSATDENSISAGIGSTLNAQGEESDTKVMKASDLGLSINRTDDTKETDSTRQAERRAQKAEETKVRRQKRIEKRQEEKERLDKLFEERKAKRAEWRKQMQDRQYEQKLEEETLVEQSAANHADTIEAMTEETINETTDDTVLETTAAEIAATEIPVEMDSAA